MYSTNYVRRAHMMRAIALAVVLYGVGDVVSTYAVVSSGGLELNPLVRALGPTSPAFIVAKIPVLLMPLGILELARRVDVDLLEVSALTFALVLATIGAVATVNNALVFV